MFNLTLFKGVVVGTKQCIKYLHYFVESVLHSVISENIALDAPPSEPSTLLREELRQRLARFTPAGLAAFTVIPAPFC